MRTGALRATLEHLPGDRLAALDRSEPRASARVDQRRPTRFRRGTLLAVGICIGIRPIAAGSAPAERARQKACYCRYPGPGPLLVLLSGLGSDMRSWSPSFLEALSRLAGVLIYDRRGYGLSPAWTLPRAAATTSRTIGPSWSSSRPANSFCSSDLK
jgi:pimeloyl-ACP methyl ester carboxylesterase